MERLKENAAAANVEFAADDEKKLRQILEQVGGAKGARYPAAILETCFGDSAELEEK